ncbi:MAG: hypothetical protein LOD87_02205, partial [Planifilum fulgidum]
FRNTGIQKAISGVFHLMNNIDLFASQTIFRFVKAAAFCRRSVNLARRRVAGASIEPVVILGYNSLIA